VTAEHVSDPAAPDTIVLIHGLWLTPLSWEKWIERYEGYHVLGPGRVLFQAATANLNPHAATKVDFKSESRAPLLVVGGGRDHTVPSSMAKEATTRQGMARSVTDYKEYPGRSRYTLGQDGWEEVADYALEWATRHAAGRAAT
jgi:hypothetical protein